MWKIAAIGECMLELSNPQAQPLARNMSLQFSYGGDTLNTAIYLARMGTDCSYVTAVGEDPYSGWLLQDWQSEGVATDWVTRLPGFNPGLYMIQTDGQGERSFSYWRKNSAATQLFSDAGRSERIFSRLETCQLIYFSGITLSIYNVEARTRFMQGLEQCHAAGVKIAFDGNYRPAGWSSATEAQHWFTQAYSLADIALPTFDDEAKLFGDARPEDTVSRLQQLAVGEVAVKHGAQGVLVASAQQQQWVATTPVAKVVDSTAAGDSFNAAYLASRAQGEAALVAAAKGHRLAAAVIQSPGAIIPLEKMPSWQPET